MQASKVEFRGHDGSLLAARLDRPEGMPRAYALFAHCFTCGKDIHAATRISAALCEMGIAVLRFDFTGLGMSEGDFANTNFSSNVADLVCAADYLRREHQAPSLLVGHSLGGTAVIAATGLIPEARAVATVGAPAEPSHVARQFGDAVDELRTTDAVDVTLAGRPFRIKRQFLDDLHAQDMAEHLAHLGRALLVMHSPIDEIVDIDNARQIYAAARHPKSFVALDGAKHLLGRREDAVYAARVLAAWAEHYLPPAEVPVPIEAGTVLVSETGNGLLENQVRSGRHVLLADEPRDVGGSDAGPTPYDYLLASLGACTSMTLRMYARRKGWPVRHVDVTLTQHSVHAQDCADCADGNGKYLQIDRVIRLEGDLDDEQRARMLEIADRCPVHRALTGKVVVSSRLQDTAGSTEEKTG